MWLYPNRASLILIFPKRQMCLYPCIQHTSKGELYDVGNNLKNNFKISSFKNKSFRVRLPGCSALHRMPSGLGTHSLNWLTQLTHLAHSLDSITFITFVVYVGMPFFCSFALLPPSARCLFVFFCLLCPVFFFVSVCPILCPLLVLS